MTVSAEPAAAVETLKAVYLIRTELGVPHFAGVSNVLGLPTRGGHKQRFACATKKGLSAAIMNPYSLDMMKIYHAFRALHQMDENCSDYIEFAASIPAQSQQAVSARRPAGTANSAADQP